MTVLPSEEMQRAFFIYEGGYDVAVALAEIRLEPVPFHQISAVLLDVIYHDKLVGIADQHLPLLINNQILYDVVAGVDLVSSFLADGLVKYFLQMADKVQSSWEYRGCHLRHLRSTNTIRIRQSMLGLGVLSRWVI